MSSISQPSQGSAVVTETQLRAGGLHLPAILMQAITHIAPCIGLVLGVQFVTTYAGNAAPLSFLIAGLILLTLGIAITQLARHITSAGGYYTYIGRTISPRVGFLASWMYFLYDPFGGLLNMVFMGFVLQGILKAEWGVNFPWPLTVVIFTLVVTVLTYFGVEISGRAMLVLGVFEMIVVILLAGTGVISPGKGGFNLVGLLPSSSPSINGLALGVVFSIFSYTGFESVAPMAEESANPRKTLPRAIIWSIIIMVFFYTLCCWGLLLGWGTHNIASFTSFNNPEDNSPVVGLARHLWPGFWAVVIIAMLNSVLAVSIACQNAVTRVYFGMARGGTLPRALAKVHPKYKTPSNAILFQTVFNIVVGIGFGEWLGPVAAVGFLAALLTLAMILVYSAGNWGVFRLYWREHRSEFNIFLHVVCPLVSTIALVAVAYYSNVPLPSGAVGWVPFVVAAWLIIGIAVVWWLGRTGREEEMERSMESVLEL